MAIWSMVLDLACNNAYALGQVIDPKKFSKSKQSNFRETKRAIAASLVEPWIKKKSEATKVKELQRKKHKTGEEGGVVPDTPAMTETDDDSPASMARGGSADMKTHTLINNVYRKGSDGRKVDVRCHLCYLIDGNMGKKSTHGCLECGKGYCVNCFAIMHDPDKVKSIHPELHWLVMRARKLELQKKYKDRQAGIGTWSSFSVPCLAKFLEDESKMLLLHHTTASAAGSEVSEHEV